MSAPKRRNLASLPALTPDFAAVPAPTAPAPAPSDEVVWWKRLLYNERKRHGQVEGVLTRHIASLEQQVNDLRGLYLSTINFPIQGTK
jgi:hypothetical protein